MKAPAFTRAEEARVLLAFEALHPTATDAVAVFDRGHWWVKAFSPWGESITWAAREGSGKIDGYIFEQVP
jgi:hypothetical protein